jgi:hypothetical protein
MPIDRRYARLAILVVSALLATSEARAVYRPHPLCDPQIGAFDDALTGDPALGALKSRVDESWRRLASHGDPDMRAASQAVRLDWLCDVKKQCGTDLSGARNCLSEALNRRERLNEDLLHQRGDQ